MPRANKEDRKRYQTEYMREVWYPKNKEKRILLNKVWQDKQKQLYKTWKSNLECELCGEKESCALDFHHINPDEKDYTVSQMIKHSFKRVLEEASKCAILCSNCHRKVHAGIAQLKERHSCKVNVEGLIPSTGSNTLQ